MKPRHPLDPKTKQAVEANWHEPMKELILRDLQRVESLLDQTEDDGATEDRAILHRAIWGMYAHLNQILAATCLAMKYPLKQWEWPDSDPLVEFAREYPMIQNSEWYQFQLGAIMIQPSNPGLIDLLPHESRVTI